MQAGAATTVITQLREHALHTDYRRMLQSGINPNLAKGTVARRIAAIVLSMGGGFADDRCAGRTVRDVRDTGGLT
jgi:hypothetical protein